MYQQSKHIFSVFKEAKSAYRERKAEIVAERRAKEDQLRVQAALAKYTIEDGESVVSRKTSKTHQSHAARSHVSSAKSSRHNHPNPNNELTRRHTEMDLSANSPFRYEPPRSKSVSKIDMDLAYGEYHPASLAKVPAPAPEPDADLGGLVTKAKQLLDEADCAHAGVTAIVQRLQKDPDAMAAVALTLAEISNIAQKMAPAALKTLRVSAPAVFALLASPQFMIAAGVGIGVTVVMFGGYKIIKKIQSGNQDVEGADMDSNTPQEAIPFTPRAAPDADAAENPDAMDEMFELGSDVSLSRIELWRRGIADVEAESLGTSVDGEFITPTAAAMTGYAPSEGGRTTKSKKSSKGTEKEKGKKSKTAKTAKSTVSSKAGSTTGGGATGGKAKGKVKRPSPLRMMFMT